MPRRIGQLITGNKGIRTQQMQLLLHMAFASKPLYLAVRRVVEIQMPTETSTLLHKIIVISVMIVLIVVPEQELSLPQTFARMQ